MPLPQSPLDRGMLQVIIIPLTVAGIYTLARTVASPTAAIVPSVVLTIFACLLTYILSGPSD